MSELKVLLSAYACEPQRGSEPGVGWNWVRQMAQQHEVWVITRCNNRPAIESELAEAPLPNAHFLYYDLPRWARFWKRRRRGLYLYYYLWQLGAYWQARRLHAEVQFDLVHHVTFVMYWMPSFLSLLPVPFIWGPVGGGESTPRAFAPALGWKGRVTETLRRIAQTLGRLDPFVRLTARRSVLAFATTAQTERRLRQMGCRSTAVRSVMGLDSRELENLSGLAAPSVNAPDPSVFRVATVGTLIAWKGVELGLRAFSILHTQHLAAQYWLIGEGPEQARLSALAETLGIAAQVHFLGALPRSLALEKLAACDVLLLPSLHDSGSCVCTEAMALGLPVVCLDLGGPALQVTGTTGFKIAAHSPSQVIADLASALGTLASNRALGRRLGQAGRRRVRQVLNWDAKGSEFAGIYRRLGRRQDSSVSARGALEACNR